jgi:hypothetical protein
VPHVDAPGGTAPHVETPTTTGGPHTPPVHDPHTGTGTGTDGTTTPHQPTTNGHAPEWDGATHPDGRPDVTQVPPEHWNDPAYDPSHPHYDGTPRGEYGNVGTVDPDVPSPSGLTNSGRLIDPNVIPEALRPFVDNGSVINDHGVLRLADDVQLTFNRTNPAHDLDEFLRQGHLQEQALRQQSLDDWETRITDYESGGRSEATAQANYRAAQIQLLADGLEHQRGLSPADALAEANRQMTGQAALHGPDQRPGGNPLQFTGMGDAGVNSSYGWGWGRGRNALRLRQAMDLLLDSAGIPDELLGDVRMNVRIVVNNTLP